MAIGMIKNEQTVLKWQNQSLKEIGGSFTHSENHSFKAFKGKSVENST